MPVTIYHNPRCAKSRETLALLKKRGVEPRIIEYLKDPPSETQLKRLLKLLGLSARALLRTKEPEYKRAKLDDPTLSEAAIIKAMVKHPILIERPIVVAGDKAALGRPPQNVLKILKMNMNMSARTPGSPGEVRQGRRGYRPKDGKPSLNQ